jgi:hypothetical protein
MRRHSVVNQLPGLAKSRQKKGQKNRNTEEWKEKGNTHDDKIA